MPKNIFTGDISGEVVGDAQIAVEGDPSVTIHMPEPNEIEKQSLDHAAFMAEMVTIQLNEAQEDDEEPAVYVAAGGQHRQWLPRGAPVRVPRSIVAVLLNARVVRHRNRSINSLEERLRNNLIRTTSLRYPFMVVEDSKKGHAWYRNMLESSR